MTKQVHIHIHRTKARDAGEGEGKWITLSPSGTHVKIDKGGEITAGPKGMTGKKPSELSSKKTSVPKSATSAPQAGPYYGAPLRGIGFSSPSESPSPRKPENLPAPNPRKILESNKKSMEALEKLVNSPGTLHSVRYDAKQTLANLRKQNEELERQIAAEMSKPVGLQNPRSAGAPEKPAAQKYSSKLASLNRLLNNAPSGSEQAKHIQSQIRATQLAQAKAMQARIDAKKEAGKPVGFAGKAAAPDPVQQARQFEEKAAKLHQQAQAEYQKNGRTDEYVRLKNEAQKATNQGTDLMVKATAPDLNKLNPPSAFGPATGEGPRGASRSDPHAPLRDVLQELREDGAGQDAARLQKALANERQGVAITSAQSIAIAKAYERASHLAYERGDQKAFKQYQEIASRYRRA